jgi:hypothetical protein
MDGKIFEEELFILTRLNNVSSNLFQGLADDTAQNPKWRRWG